MVPGMRTKKQYISACLAVGLFACVARGSDRVSEAEARRLATQYRDEWIRKERPQDSAQLRAGVIESVKPTKDGWQISFVTRTGHGQPEGMHDYFVHVYIDRGGKLQKIVRGPDIVSRSPTNLPGLPAC